MEDVLAGTICFRLVPWGVARCELNCRNRVAILMVVLAFGIAAGLASAQTKSSANSTWNPPRTPDGQPDIQGNWGARAARELGLSAAFDIENGEPPEEGTLQGGRKTFPSPQVIVDPPDGKVPYQSWARALY